MDKIRAVFYARVSTEEEEQLNAIEKQIEENRDVIKTKGWELVDEYIDRGKSGTQTKRRDNYQRLLDDITKDKFDIIVVKDQSRLQRNTFDWYAFLNCILKNDKRLYLYLENKFFTSDEKFIFGIKAMMAEEYSRDLSKKTNNAVKRRQAKGKPIITNNTWGYKNVNGVILIDEDESKIVQQIFSLFAQGKGGRVVARLLAEQGVRNHKGKLLSENTIRDIVKNPLFKGTAVFNKEHFDFESKRYIKNPREKWIYAPGAVPSIVNDEVWEKANANLSERKTIDRSNGIVGKNTGNNMLSSKIVCGECGSLYHRNKRQKGIYWYCSQGVKLGKAKDGTGQKCASLNMKEEEILNLLQQIGDDVIPQDKKDTVLAECLERIASALESDERTFNIESIDEELERLTVRKDNLMDLLLDGTITKEDYTEKINKIGNRIKELQSQQENQNNRMRENAEVKEKISKLRILLNEEKHDISVPIMCNHLDTFRIYQGHVDVYLDFLKDLKPLVIGCNREGRQKIYDMPICVPSLIGITEKEGFLLYKKVYILDGFDKRCKVGVREREITVRVFI